MVTPYPVRIARRGGDGDEDGLRTRPEQPVRMHPWIVVMTRAWLDDGDLRVRMLLTGSAADPEVSTAASAADAANQLNAWLGHYSRSPRRRSKSDPPTFATPRVWALRRREDGGVT